MTLLCLHFVLTWIRRHGTLHQSSNTRYLYPQLDLCLLLCSLPVLKHYSYRRVQGVCLNIQHAISSIHASSPQQKYWNLCRTNFFGVAQYACQKVCWQVLISRAPRFTLSVAYHLLRGHLWLWTEIGQASPHRSKALDCPTTTSRYRT